MHLHSSVGTYCMQLIALTVVVVHSVNYILVMLGHLLTSIITTATAWVPRDRSLSTAQYIGLRDRLHVSIYVGLDAWWFSIKSSSNYETDWRPNNRWMRSVPPARNSVSDVLVSSERMQSKPIIYCSTSHVALDLIKAESIAYSFDSFSH